MRSEWIRWEWVTSHGGEIWTRFLEHLTLTFWAVLLGVLISFPVAIAAHRFRRLYAPVTTVAGLLYAIPSFALFVSLGYVTGFLTTTTALIGLVSYTLLTLIRNIVAGLDSVPEDAREAAIGMGYTRSQLLWKVELPLAIPVILAGVRIATVTTVGLVTVTAVIGKGGLGYFILQGLQRFFTTATLVGAVLSMLLAIVMDRSLIALERRITPWSRKRGLAT